MIAAVAIICLGAGGFVGYVTGAVLTDAHNKEKTERLWQELREMTKNGGRYGEE